MRLFLQDKIFKNGNLHLKFDIKTFGINMNYKRNKSKYSIKLIFQNILIKIGHAQLHFINKFPN